MGNELNSKQLYAGNCVIIDAEQLELAMHANGVHLQRIKSKEAISCAWPDPFSLLNSESSLMLKVIFYFRVRLEFWASQTMTPRENVTQ